MHFLYCMSDYVSKRTGEMKLNKLQRETLKRETKKVVSKIHAKPAAQEHLLSLNIFSGDLNFCIHCTVPQNLLGGMLIQSKYNKVNMKTPLICDMMLTMSCTCNIHQIIWTVIGASKKILLPPVSFVKFAYIISVKTYLLTHSLIGIVLGLLLSEAYCSWAFITRGLCIMYSPICNLNEYPIFKGVL